MRYKHQIFILKDLQGENEPVTYGNLSHFTLIIVVFILLRAVIYSRDLC